MQHKRALFLVQHDVVR